MGTFSLSPSLPLLLSCECYTAPTVACSHIMKFSLSYSHSLVCVRACVRVCVCVVYIAAAAVFTSVVLG